MMELVYGVQLDSGAKYTIRAAEELGLKTGDFCIIRKDFFLDYGCVTATRGEFKADDHSEDLPRAERKANIQDKGKQHENEMRAKSAYRTAEKFVESLGLDMKLLNSHYTFDKKLLTIQFTADGRIDFRELVKQLTQALNTRIELRQIGVRDETAIIGGIGVCGQELCCSRFLKSFASINVKMAKDQDLSLNPSSISGMCGRLKCCLKYEHEGYKELDRGMPKRGQICKSSEGTGRVVDRNLLKQTVTLKLEDTASYKTLHRDEVKLQRDRSSSKQQDSQQERPQRKNNQDRNQGKPKSENKQDNSQSKAKNENNQDKAQNKPKNENNQERSQGRPRNDKGQNRSQNKQKNERNQDNSRNNQKQEKGQDKSQNKQDRPRNNQKQDNPQKKQKNKEGQKKQDSNSQDGSKKPQRRQQRNKRPRNKQAQNTESNKSE